MVNKFRSRPHTVYRTSANATNGGANNNAYFTDNAYANQYYTDNSYANPYQTNGGVNVNTMSLKGFFIGDSLTAFCGGYQAPLFLQDSNTWTVSKSNPCVITIPAGHSFVTGNKCKFFGFIGQAEINELTTTVTVPDSTHIQLDGVNSTAWTGTYTSYGRIYATELAERTRSAQSFINNANTLLGGRFEQPTDFIRGVAGDPASNLLNRLQYEFTSVIDANFAHILIGRNDLNAEVPATTIMGYITAAYNWIRANKGASFPILLGTVCPNNTATTTAKAQTILLNNMIKAFGSSFCFIVDYDKDVNDGAGNWISGFNIDNQHQASAGALVMGGTLRSTMLLVYGRGAGFVLDAANKIANPSLSGTGGSAPSITNNGIATSWTATFSGTAPQITREVKKSAGDKQILAVACPAGNGVNTLSLQQDVLAATLVVGDTYRMVTQLKVISFSGSGIVTEISAKDQGRTTPTVLASSFGRTAATGAFLMSALITESAANPLLIVSPELIFVSGQTLIRNTVNLRYDTTSGDVNMEVEVDNVQIYKI